MAPRKGGSKTAKGGAQQQQQQPAAPPALQVPGAAAAAAGGVASGSGAAGQQAPAASLSSLHQLEERRKRLGHQLKDVERQIYDLETLYLEGCNPNANALTGYEGLRNGVGSSKPSKSAAVAPEDRIFSGSSTSTVTR